MAATESILVDLVLIAAWSQPVVPASSVGSLQETGGSLKAPEELAHSAANTVLQTGDDKTTRQDLSCRQYLLNFRLQQNSSI